jgi:hypothetical protein
VKLNHTAPRCINVCPGTLPSEDGEPLMRGGSITVQPAVITELEYQRSCDPTNECPERCRDAQKGYVAHSNEKAKNAPVENLPACQACSIALTTTLISTMPSRTKISASGIARPIVTIVPDTNPKRIKTSPAKILAT